MKIPTAKQVKAARQRAGLTQTDAGKVIGVQLRTWQGYEQGERTMPAGFWELFLIKTKRK